MTARSHHSTQNCVTACPASEGSWKALNASELPGISLFKVASGPLATVSDAAQHQFGRVHREILLPVRCFTCHAVEHLTSMCGMYSMGLAWLKK